MANMSYCRWENTSNDIWDCVRDLQEEAYSPEDVKEYIANLSEDEQRGFKRVLSAAKALVEAVGEDEDEDPNEFKR